MSLSHRNQSIDLLCKSLKDKKLSKLQYFRYKRKGIFIKFFKEFCEGLMITPLTGSKSISTIELPVQSNQYFVILHHNSEDICLKFAYK